VSDKNYFMLMPIMYFVMLKAISSGYSHVSSFVNNQNSANPLGGAVAETELQEIQTIQVITPPPLPTPPRSYQYLGYLTLCRTADRGRRYNGKTLGC
jgi:hypothetical protein